MHYNLAENLEQTGLNMEKLAFAEEALCVNDLQEDTVKDAAIDIEAKILPIPAQASVNYYSLLENVAKNENETSKQNNGTNTAMEKFRKRLIHTVAQHLRENKPLEELWPNMKALTFNCKQLWNRMRALTLKKISRLLPVDDRTDRIAKVARMTFTDWLMFDLVLVHEDIDLIASDRKNDAQSIPKVLKELFVLVQRFNLEESEKSVDPGAWAAATLFYNRNGRRHVSPMLLQKRWYQMKRSARIKFAEFWQVYKGHNSTLEKAREFAPDILQQAIAKRYTTIMTQDFMKWKDLVDNNKIVMPEAFTRGIKALPEPCDLEDPDLILLEPEIETINLDQDSECDENENNEPKISEAKEIAKETVNHSTSDQVDPLINLDYHFDVSLVRTEEDLGIKTEPIEFDSALADETINPLSDIVEQQKLIEAEEEENYDDAHTDLDVENEHYDYNASVPQSSDNTTNDADVCNTIETTDQSSHYEWEIPINAQTVNQPLGNGLDPQLEKPVKLEASDIFPEPIPTDNIEFVDDGIELIEDDEIIEVKPVATEIVHSSILDSSDAANDGSGANLSVSICKKELVDDALEFVDDDDSTTQAKFDLKLLMIPVVYTTKVEQISVLKNCNVYNSVDVTRILSDVIAESMPVSAKSVDVKTELDNLDNNERESLHDDVEKDAVDDLITFSSQNSNEGVEMKTRVKASSRLFQKPRTREYSTVQLCKNPDFNTKLKRLSVGFCTIARNRQFLKLCKPVTVDLHRSFESYLNNGSLLLDDLNQFEPNKCRQDVQFNPIMPSAMPIQSLVDKEKVNINDLLTYSLSNEYEAKFERNISDNTILYKKDQDEKINPQDIIKVKRLNNFVLTAEISPFQSTNKMDAKDIDDSSHQVIYNDHCSINSNNPNYFHSPSTNPSPCNIISSGMNLERNESLNTKNVESSSKLQYNNCEKVPTCKRSNIIKQKKTIVNTKPKKLPKPISVPWSSYSKTVTPQIDFNLAIDTLNKMLQALGDTNFIYKKGKYIEKSSSVKDKNECQAVKKRNENMAEKETTMRNSNKMKRRYCCWYSRYRNKVKSTNLKTKSHKCGEVCTCCCRDLQEIKKPEEPSDIQNKCLDMDKEAETAVENLQECVALDIEGSDARVDVDQSSVPCIVLSDDEVDTQYKKPKFRVFAKSKSPIRIQVKSNKEFINLNAVLAEKEAKKNVANSENDNIIVARNLPDLVTSSATLMAPLQTKDKIRVISGDGSKNYSLKSSVEPKNFALSVNYDGKFMQLQITPEDKTKVVKNVKNMLTPVNGMNTELCDQSDNAEMQLSDYSISSPVLPSGVHLVLLPNQQVMPYMEYGCDLSEKELKDIKYILSYVQNQLNGQKKCDIKYPLHSDSVVSTGNLSLRELNIDNAKVATLVVPNEAACCTVIEESDDNDNLAREKQTDRSSSVILNSDKSKGCEFPKVHKDNSDDCSVENNKNYITESKSFKNIETGGVHKAINELGCEDNSDVIEDLVRDTLILKTLNAESIENNITDRDNPQIKTNNDDGPEDYENQDSTIGKIKIKQFAALSESFPEVTNMTEKHSKGKTSILSDLMEMSGISSEDVFVSPEKQVVSAHQLSGFDNSDYSQIPQSTDRDETEIFSRSKSNDGFRKTQAVPIRIMTPNTFEGSINHEGRVEISGKMPNLVPIQKLHLKNQVEKQSEHPHAVIDVDSDDEVEILQNNNITSGPQMKKSIAHTLIEIRPEKRIPLILRRAPRNSIEPKVVRGKSRQEKEIVQKKSTTKRKRKECLKEKAKIEAKIDLLDSDAPMEEEYLVDSFDSDSDSSKKNTRLRYKPKSNLVRRNTNVYDYSSDEESISTNFGSDVSSLLEKSICTSGESELEGSDDSTLYLIRKRNKRKRKIGGDNCLIAKSENNRAKMELKTYSSHSRSSKKLRLNKKQKIDIQLDIHSGFSLVETNKSLLEQRNKEAEEELSQFITFNKNEEKQKTDVDADTSPLATLKNNTESKNNITDTDSSDDEPLAKKVQRQETQHATISNSITSNICEEQNVRDVKESVDSSKNNTNV